jgi:asparagine synthase (glutamine-hydrolysing)
MCGILGVAGAVAIDAGMLRVMRDTLRHRGPDDAGDWWSADGRVGLAHRRLAIIDLSRDGRQPMTDRSGNLQIVFNGEIYNYRELREELRASGAQFRTQTDTEVILEAYRAWGLDCLKHLNGMFAFALYDQPQHRLVLARDRAGEKPLFYRVAGGALTFASELKAILADPSCPREIDSEALDCYLAFGYVPHEKCLVHGVQKLPQGHALTFDVGSGTSHTWSYWALPAPGGHDTPEADLVDELQHLLEDSVRLRLIADVPVGVMLSGGLDSSLVAALASRVSAQPVRTFTISFPGHGHFDEAPHARRVAAHLGTEHTELPAEPATLDLLSQLARQYDEPIADSSMVPTYLLSRLIRAEATVALGGDGGDELFGGYPHHSWMQHQAMMGRLIPEPAKRFASGAVKRLMPVGVKGRNYALALTAPRPFDSVQFNVLFDQELRTRLLGPVGSLTAHPGTAERVKAALCTPGRSTLQEITALDFRTYLPDDILVKVDRASMLCSLEVRAPFLDQRLIEFAFGRVPDRFRATRSARKILLRKLARRLLPPDFDVTRKQGFSLPLADWFKGDWGAFIESVLTDRTSVMFDKSVVRELLQAQRAGRANMHRLFALAMFELWRREYGLNAISPALSSTPLASAAF